MIRFDANAVQKIADRIEEITGGRFRSPYVSRPGDGVNFVDTNRMVSWRGPRRASAYYLGILYGVAPEECAKEPVGGYWEALDMLEGDDCVPYYRGLEDSVYYRPATS